MSLFSKKPRCFNERTCKIFSFIGKSPFDLIHPDYHDKIKQRISRIMKDISVAPYEEVLFVKHDGTTVLVESTATPFESENGPSIQVILRDISERRKIEKRN